MAARSGDVVVATIDGADSIMRRMTVINGDHKNIYISTASDHAVHVEHVAYFQSREPF